uniref:Uncharacterized protein n=1 Tax=Anopheles darlingi TaxID=43151 RepID=A0A2M4D8H5_ANODA
MIVRLLLLLLVVLLLLLLMMLMMMVSHIGGWRTRWMYHRLRLLLTGDVTLFLLLRLLRLLLLLLVVMVVMVVLMQLSRLYRGSSRWCDGKASTAVHGRWRWRSLNHRRLSTNPQSILAVAFAIRLPYVASSIRTVRSLQLMVAIEGVRYGACLVGVTDR